MRVPNLNKIKGYQVSEHEYEISKISSYTEPIVGGIDFTDEKAKVRFVNYIKKLVRGSLEYKNLIQFLKDELDMKYCSYFNKINKDVRGIKIEIHHSPFSLFDLIYITINKFIEEGYDINPFAIANEVMKVHYKGQIGLLPLSETVHELAHSGKIIIPIHFVFGDIATYYEEYGDYMTDEQKSALAKNIEVSKLMEETPNILKKKYVYLDIDGMSVIKERE